MCVAFADESMRQVNGEAMYLIGATVFHAAADATSSLVNLNRGAPRNFTGANLVVRFKRRL